MRSLIMMKRKTPKFFLLNSLESNTTMKNLFNLNFVKGIKTKTMKLKSQMRKPK